MKNLSICYLPSQWRLLEVERLRASVCVVIDVIRATTTIAAALAAGASGIRAVASLAEAEMLKAERPERILAGERHGVALPGFDLGNSPRAMTRDLVGGRELILTTTNGTQTLAACTGARAVLTCGLVNLGATADKMRSLGPPWLILCAGFEDEFGLDDAIVAGALAEVLEEPNPFVSLYHAVQAEMVGALIGSRAGQELVKIGLQDDVPYCAQRDILAIAPTMDSDGIIRPG